ncbi:MAG: hypothetical protein ACJ72O_09685 [Marmoricola sp.]
MGTGDISTTTQIAGSAPGVASDPVAGSRQISRQQSLVDRQFAALRRSRTGTTFRQVVPPQGTGAVPGRGPRGQE